jgi:hypothetical protein
VKEVKTFNRQLMVELNSECPEEPTQVISDPALIQYMKDVGQLGGDPLKTSEDGGSTLNRSFDKTFLTG